jgi:hypothetical protein
MAEPVSRYKAGDKLQVVLLPSKDQKQSPVWIDADGKISVLDRADPKTREVKIGDIVEVIVTRNLERYYISRVLQILSSAPTETALDAVTVSLDATLYSKKLGKGVYLFINAAEVKRIEKERIVLGPYHLKRARVIMHLEGGAPSKPREEGKK